MIHRIVIADKYMYGKPCIENNMLMWLEIGWPLEGVGKQVGLYLTTGYP